LGVLVSRVGSGGGRLEMEMVDVVAVVAMLVRE